MAIAATMGTIIRSKPDPEVFLKAAQFLDTPPGECVVVEDAVAGAEAGHAGGFTVPCVGDAAQQQAGHHNMSSIRELINLV